MKEMISMCGLNCSECPAYIATQKDDDSLRNKVTEEWGAMFKKDFKVEDINCDGCLTKGGRSFAHCNSCAIRSCGFEKSVENCAQCSDYSCEKLDSFLKNFPDQDARNRLERIRSSM